MPRPQPTDDQLRSLISALRDHGSQSKAARALGMPVPTFKTRLDLARRRGLLVPGSDAEKALNEGEARYRENGDEAEWDGVVSRPVRTLSELMALCGVDEDVWEVERWSCNAWTTAMKLQTRAEGKITDEAPRRVQNYRVSAVFRRRVAKRLCDATDGLIERIKSHAPRFGPIKRREPKGDAHMLEISPFDAHFGKVAWRRETGGDYDLKITRDLFVGAFEELLSDTSHVHLDSILIPVGQDFIHFDAIVADAATTRNGTLQKNTDSRWAKVFELASESMIWAVERCLVRAPVKLIWVPGNHDYFTSYHLCRELSAYFHRTKDVTVDVEPTSRKYVQHGVSLIGFTHGDEEKHADLPNIMAGSVPHLWATSKVREWHVGHFHKKKETRYNEGDTFGSVKVRVLPSLSGTDAWHYRKGYVNTPRACEAYLWSAQRGLRAYFNAPVFEGE
jgi:hypothetical protein